MSNRAEQTQGDLHYLIHPTYWVNVIEVFHPRNLIYLFLSSFLSPLDHTIMWRLEAIKIEEKTKCCGQNKRKIGKRRSQQMHFVSTVRILIYREEKRKEGSSLTGFKTTERDFPSEKVKRSNF